MSEAPAMKITILTIFPEMFESVLNSSILGRARAQGILDIRCVDIRPFSDRKHKNTDDYPFGGGAGMAPMRSHIMHLFKTEKTSRPVSFWYGARALKEVPYMDEFLEIQREFPNFKFHLALDRPDPQADAAGVKYTPGFVHNVLYENYLKNHQAPEDNIYLMCGPPMMISSVVKMLDSLGVPPENILYDNFGS